MAAEVLNTTPPSSLLRSPAYAPVPLYFGPPDRPLFGWYHPAACSKAPDDTAIATAATAVVLCKPVGSEAVYTHAAYRYCAEQLAEAGYPCLRFDYDGTGDSFGSDEDSDRVRSWIASIGFAIETLRCESGIEDITLFGVRFGATLAAAAAAERGDIKNIILWAACRNGRSFLREMRALHAAHRMADAETASQSQSPSGSLAPEQEEAAGFFYTGATIEAMLQMDATSLKQKPASESLFIGRDDLPGDGRLEKHFLTLGTAVTTVSWPGYRAMMQDALYTKMPSTVINSMIGWLQSRVSHAPLPCEDATRKNVAADLITAEYREEPILRGSNPACFGILTRPQARNDRSRTVILLLTVGANHHIGPNRMYVTLSRLLAASGFPVFRLDIPGVGDSAQGEISAQEQVYSGGAIEDIDAAIAHLGTLLEADRFVTVGLCSGAYLAFKSAAANFRVAAQVLINPQTFEWQEGDSLEVRLRESYKPTRHYLTALQKLETFKRTLHGNVNIKGIASILSKRAIGKSKALLKQAASLTLQRKPHETQVCRAFREMGRRGVNTLFIFASEDIGIDVMSSHLGKDARSVNAKKMVQVEMIDGADHTFTQKAPREKMLALIVNYLVNLYPATPPGK